MLWSILAAVVWLSLGVLSVHANRFGLVESEGYINLTWADGAFLFNLTRPVVADGDVARWAIGATRATPVLIVQ